MTFFLPFYLSSQQAEPYERGKIIEKIVCLADSTQFYSVYLPPDYSQFKPRQWAILFAFDPGARSTLPLQLFEPAAEKYNYIVVCSGNIMNGPRDPIIKGMKSVWNDVCSRFHIDKQRVYAAGFSGGARMASFFSIVINNPVRGIIACGAGLSEAINPGMLKSTDYCGIVGFADFNYPEMVTLDQTFDPSDTTHRFFYYDSNHQWPPESLCTRAIQWFEILAFKNKSIPPDHTIIKKIFDTELQCTEERKKSGDIFYAAADYEAIALTFNGLLPSEDIETIRQQAAQLKQTKEYRNFQKNEGKRLEREKKYIRIFVNTFAELKSPDFMNNFPSQVIAKLDIDRLKKEMNKNKSRYDAGMAERLLANLSNKAFEDGTTYLEQGDFNHADIFLQIAAEAGERTPFYKYTLYYLSGLYALRGKTDKAFQYLNEAINNGFDNISYMETDKNLEPIRSDNRYKEIVGKLKNKKK